MTISIKPMIIIIFLKVLLIYYYMKKVVLCNYIDILMKIYFHYQDVI
jgi:hypothetical protein